MTEPSPPQRPDRQAKPVAGPLSAPVSPSKHVLPRAPRRLLSPLMLRIMIVNVVALIILVGGVLYLNRFEGDLVDQRLAILESRGGIIAGALGESAVAGPDAVNITADVAAQVLARLLAGTQTRALLFGPDGRLLVDSQDASRQWQVTSEPLAPARDEQGPLDRLAIWLENQLHSGLDAFKPLRPVDPAPSAGVGNLGALPEVGSALTGRPSALLRLRSDGVYAIYVTAPVQRFRRVVGALLLVDSTADIEEIVRAEQLQTLEIFVAAVGLTILLSFFLGRTLVRPIRHLARAAEQVRHNVAGEASLPEFTRRSDEIGDLSRSLSAMTRALYNQIDAGERFAADVAHELKNPLTSMRSALETLAWTHDDAVKARLLAVLADDVQRLDRLIQEISEASRLDAELTRGRMDPLDLAALLDALVNSYGHLGPAGVAAAVSVSFHHSGGKIAVHGLPERLGQVWRNLIDNAISFSPIGAEVRVSLSQRGRIVTVHVDDDGPGLPEGSESKIFKRFYSERPDAEHDEGDRSKPQRHSGLGLAISMQIIEAHGGRLTADNRRGETDRVVGARFTVTLPLAGAS